MQGRCRYIFSTRFQWSGWRSYIQSKKTNVPLCALAPAHHSLSIVPTKSIRAIPSWSMNKAFNRPFGCAGLLLTWSLFHRSKGNFQAFSRVLTSGFLANLAARPQQYYSHTKNQSRPAVNAGEIKVWQKFPSSRRGGNRALVIIKNQFGHWKG